MDAGRQSQPFSKVLPCFTACSSQFLDHPGHGGQCVDKLTYSTKGQFTLAEVLKGGPEHLCGMPQVDCQHPAIQGDVVTGNSRYLGGPGSAAQMSDQPQVIDLTAFLFAQIKECTQPDSEQAGTQEVFHRLAKTKV